MARIVHIAMKVDDLDGTADFYEKVFSLPAAGKGPRIHHFAVEVDDLEKYVSQAREFGCEILSDPTKAPVKLRIPGGPIMEIVPEGRYRKGSERSAAQSD